MSSGDLKRRVISGVAALVVVVPVLISGDFWWLCGLAFLAACWGLHEIVSMGMPGQRALTFPLAVLLGAGYFATAAFSTTEGGVPGLDPLREAGVDPTFLLVILTVLLSATVFVLTARSTEGLADRWAHFALGPPYVAAALGLVPALAVLPGGRGWLWVPLIVAWFGDMGGYFVGRRFGKHKLAPLVSPKKTWEGFFGGLLLATLALIALKYFVFDLVIAPEATMELYDCLVLGIAGASAGVVGDLTASMLKRTHGVKDSGRFLPGHGGMLDRVDALIFVLPVVWLWLVVLRPLVLPG